MRWLSLFITLLSFPATAQIALVEHGVICPGDVTTGAQRDAPQTTRGYTGQLKPGIQIDIRTTKVPFASTLSFGPVLRSTGAVTQPFTMRVTRPNGQIETYDATASRRQERAFVYTFKHSRSHLYGIWTWEVIVDGQVIVTTRSNVVRPADAQDILDICNGTLLMS